MIYSASPSLPAGNLLSPSDDFSLLKSARLRGRLSRWIRPQRRSIPVASVSFSVEDVADVLQNKVLISSALACTIGQLSKPFTSAMKGNGLDFGAVIRSGGMPSTHSAGVMAATICLGLERGFSDPIFGVSAVFATFVMYDAQGVRREVGRHAKNLNEIAMQNRARSALFRERQRPEDNYRSSVPVNAGRRGSRASTDEGGAYEELEQEPIASYSSKAVDFFDGVSERSEIGYSPLEESVGHTEVQVVAGAILGFLVSLTVELLTS